MPVSVPLALCADSCHLVFECSAAALLVQAPCPVAVGAHTPRAKANQLIELKEHGVPEALSLVRSAHVIRCDLARVVGRRFLLQGLGQPWVLSVGVRSSDR